MRDVRFFFFYRYGDHRDLHLLGRRQRQMCIRDSLGVGLSAVGETGIPGVTVECVDIGKNTNGEGRSLGRY